MRRTFNPRGHDTGAKKGVHPHFSNRCNMLHFVGFRDGSQLWRAMQIFGIPDFIHIKWDSRAAFGGERDDSDIFIFAQGTIDSDPDMVHTVDDSSVTEDMDCNLLHRKIWHYRPLTGQVPW